jgi:hypothetical protein
MTGELAVALGDRSSRRLHGGSIVRLCVLQCRQGLFEALMPLMDVKPLTVRLGVGR